MSSRAGRIFFDLTARAQNGLRRGRTTGACATAAVKAALLLLVHGERVDEVEIGLPDPRYSLKVPVRAVYGLDDGAARAEVVKEAGDDPDCTDGATIFAAVRRNGLGELRFLAGPGVGTITQPGIRIPVGEPAINPVPRQMMREAVAEVLEGADAGFDLSIGCEGGEVLARKTFNPRLGIVGGISILGTSGLVEPMSLSAYMASIEVYIRVALAEGSEVAFAPGKIGTAFARAALQLPPKRIVSISNFIGFALDATERELAAQSLTLASLWLVGHPGKLVKPLAGDWDTHSSKSAMAMHAVAQVAAECGFAARETTVIAHANTVEAVLQALRDHPCGRQLWCEVERRIAALMRSRLTRVQRVEVRLFGLNGVALGQAQ